MLPGSHLVLCISQTAGTARQDAGPHAEHAQAARHTLQNLKVPLEVLLDSNQE